MKIRYSLFISLLLLTFGQAQKEMMVADTIRISKTSDFEVSGDGTSDNWKMARWVDVKQRAYATISMQTKVKVLYSDTGVYFLYFNKDRKLNASIKEDGKHLWTEDVVEVFLWPDTTKEIYFEYELSPLNYELPLMVINIDRKPHRWQAWYFEDDRKIIHKTTVQGGEKKEGALIESWMAEFFIPYTLLSSIGGKPPVQGEAWRVNFNRVDYLDEKEIYWSWQDLPGSFHDINRFGTMIFE